MVCSALTLLRWREIQPHSKTCLTESRATTFKLTWIDSFCSVSGSVKMRLKWTRSNLLQLLSAISSLTLRTKSASTNLRICFITLSMISPMWVPRSNLQLTPRRKLRDSPYLRSSCAVLLQTKSKQRYLVRPKR